MKIAMMVRGYLPVPRPSDMIYAPIDLAVAIAEGLAARGHSVDFFAPQGSYIPDVTVETLNVRPLAHNQTEFASFLGSSEKLHHYVPDLWDKIFADEMFRRAAKGRYDLLHFHHPEVALSSAVNYPQIPVVYTLHDPIYQWYRELFDIYRSKNQHFISISDNQRRDAPDLNFQSTIYNGTDPALFTFSAAHEDYLLFAGRIVPEKGIKEAIQIAEATNHRLFIIGPVYDDHREYFNQYVKPHLNEKILYLSFMEQEQLVKYYQKAKALLMPIQWEEPFGLTMTESMACGTPVIALRRGSVPEVLVDGKTGFICDHIQDMVKAVKKVDAIDRAECRRHVENMFDILHMVDGYERTFEAIVRKSPVGLRERALRSARLKGLPQQLRMSLTKTAKNATTPTETPTHKSSEIKK